MAITVPIPGSDSDLDPFEVFHEDAELFGTIIATDADTFTVRWEDPDGGRSWESRYSWAAFGVTVRKAHAGDFVWAMHSPRSPYF